MQTGSPDSERLINNNEFKEQDLQNKLKDILDTKGTKLKRGRKSAKCAII